MITDLIVTHTSLFWLTNLAAIDTAPTTGGATTTLMRVPVDRATGFGHIQRLVTGGAYLYFTRDGDLERLQLSGGSPSVLAKSLFITAVAADSTNIYAAALIGNGLLSIASARGTVTTLNAHARATRQLTLFGGLVWARHGQRGHGRPRRRRRGRIQSPLRDHDRRRCVPR